MAKHVSLIIVPRVPEVLQLINTPVTSQNACRAAFDELGKEYPCEFDFNRKLLEIQL